jgi:molybdate transport system regulatory protein
MTARSPAKKTLGAAPAASVPQAAKAIAKFRLRVSVVDVIAIGPGKVSLIEAIGATGSITEAAKSLGMSYRRAWLLLEELNQSLREPAVASIKGGPRGGGSELTEVGLRLIDLYRRIEVTAAKACEADVGALLKLLAR